MSQEPKTEQKTDRKTLTLAYLAAVADHRYDDVTARLAPDLRFRGPTTARNSAEDYVGALKRLGAIHVRSDVKRVFADGDEVCVIYDFVTDTAAGALTTIEWLHFDADRIRSIDLYYDQLPWQTALAAMAERAERAGRTEPPVARPVA